MRPRSSPAELQHAADKRGSPRQHQDEPMLVAVKSVPLRWLRRSPAEFKQKNPTAVEHPWRDMSILKHLNSISYPYTVDLMGVFEAGHKAYIMTSFATEGDLFG